MSGERTLTSGESSSEDITAFKKLISKAVTIMLCERLIPDYDYRKLVSKTFTVMAVKRIFKAIKDTFMTDLFPEW